MGVKTSMDCDIPVIYLPLKATDINYQTGKPLFTFALLCCHRTSMEPGRIAPLHTTNIGMQA
jgi:hypothetical protein